jgi:hypothetical protein
MDWTLKEFKDANHNPVAVVNSDSGKEPLVINAKIGISVTKAYVVVLRRGGISHFQTREAGRDRDTMGQFRMVISFIDRRLMSSFSCEHSIRILKDLNPAARFEHTRIDTGSIRSPMELHQMGVGLST